MVSCKRVTDLIEEERQSLDVGRIVGMGTRAELLRGRGCYIRLYIRQFRHERGQEYGFLRAPSLGMAAAR
jgi:hypothetical protein